MRRRHARAHVDWHKLALVFFLFLLRTAGTIRHERHVRLPGSGPSHGGRCVMHVGELVLRRLRLRLRLRLCLRSGLDARRSGSRGMGNGSALQMGGLLLLRVPRRACVRSRSGRVLRGMCVRVGMLLRDVRHVGVQVPFTCRCRSATCDPASARHSITAQPTMLLSCPSASDSAAGRGVTLTSQDMHSHLLINLVCVHVRTRSKRVICLCLCLFCLVDFLSIHSLG